MAGFLRFKNCHIQVKASDEESEAFLFKVGVELDGKLNPLTGMVINLVQVDEFFASAIPSTGHVLQVASFAEFVQNLQNSFNQQLPQNVSLVNLSFDDWPHRYISISKAGVIVKWREDFVFVAQDCKKKFLVEVAQKLPDLSALDEWIFSPRTIWHDCVNALVKQMPIANMEVGQIYDLLETTLDLIPQVNGISARDLADRSLFEVRRIEG